MWPFKKREKEDALDKSSAEDGAEPFYYDEIFEELIPKWRESSPEEYIARHWLQFGAFSLSSNEFKDKEMERWVHRFEVIFHDSEEIKKCRLQYLTVSEYLQQEQELEGIMRDGF